MATIKPITDEENVRIYNLICPNETPPESFGPGVSAFDDNGRWVFGIHFTTPTGDKIAGACIPELQGSGQWIRYWPEMKEWALTIHNPFYVEQDDSSPYGDLMVKLGGVEKTTFINVDDRRLWNRVTFK